MKIQKLKIFGFKSFAQKVEILFEGNGITAIVGPNGCGKSNIVDAIRWGTGETKAGELRMGRMQEVIFSGTAERPAMSMAEVSLIIENDRGLLPSEYAEVMVTRKVFNNGESEYLINNQECRATDIKNLFADTGMGADSYSQMDQRMVDDLLSDRPDERRKKKKKAAGVSKYRQHRKEASAKLERIQTDMESIATKLQYAKKQFWQQEKMLARSQELRKLKERLKELDVSINLEKYAECKASLHALSTTKIKGETELDTLKTRLAELELKIEEKHLLIAGDEEKLRECEQEVSMAATEIAKLNEAYKHLQNRDRELEENKARCEHEISENENGILSFKDEIQDLESEFETLAPEIEEIERQGKKEIETLQTARNMIEDLRIMHRELSNKRLASVQAEGKLKSLWQKTDTEIEMLGELALQAAKDIQNFDSQIRELEVLEKDKESEANENKNKSEILAERGNVLANEKETLNETIDTLANRRMESLGEKTRLESRLEALQSISENTGDLEGNKWLLNQKITEGATLLSSQIEVLESKYAALAEFCLDSSVQALLMQNQDTVLACAKDLNSDSLGRAMLAWNTTIFEEKANLGETDAVPLTALVKCGENSRALLNSLLSKYFLVKDLDTAAMLAQKYAGRDLWFCTEDCQAICSLGLAKVGREQKEKFGVLQQNAEIKNLKTAALSLGEKIGMLDSQISAAKEKLRELSVSISNAAEEKQNADTYIIKANSEAEIAKAQASALKVQKEKIEQDVSNFDARLQELKTSRSSNTELNAAELELEQAEREFEKTDGELREQEQVLRNQEELTAELASSLNAKKSLLSQKENRMNSVREQIQTMNNALVLRNEELAGISGKKGSLQRELESKALQIEKEHELLANKENLRDAAREKYSVMAGDIEEWRSEVREINRSLREKEKSSHEIDLAIQASGTSLERARERIFQEYEFDLEKEPAEQAFVPIRIEEREANVEMHGLREKIKAIGPVNASAAEDFEAEKERMLSIEAQYNDLKEFQARFQTIVERLDMVARDRFLDTFRKIQRNYQDVFTSLMPGGEAFLTMQSDLDPLEAEIEINARPPGKKMRGVRALSGGERALTATSLLFALYMVKPSPYCILDEIDGPLDDSNIGRFMGLLRRFSHQTQFVVITHNKRTMAVADRLYGVTQEIKGISKVGSVRLEDIND
ncbi:MAG: chromosome segregation protein SMC [Fibromonadaceae bacterium]|nr:chromosome segregation protein SMC [Fibromonadaceae bacterium]